MISRCVSLGVVALLVLVALMSVGGARADNPIPAYNITFSSMGEIEAFFQSHDFYIAKYDKDAGTWKEDAIIQKNLIYHAGKYYVIAPYFYDDANGYPHLIYPSGVMITLRDLDNPNATVVITGFQNAVIDVENVRCRVIIGKAVNYLGRGVNKDVPWWAYTGVGTIVWGIQATANAYTPRIGVWQGVVDSTLTVSNSDNVEVRNFFFGATTQMPILMKDVGTVKFSNLRIVPPSNTVVGSDAIHVAGAEKVVFENSNYICGFSTALYLKDVGEVKQNGYLVIDGRYYDGDELKYGGTGIYADRVANYTTEQKNINAEGKFFVGITAVAYYNETNGTVWGNITYVIAIFGDGQNDGSFPDEPYSWVQMKNVSFVGTVVGNLTTEEGWAEGEIDFREKIHFEVYERNETTGVDLHGAFDINSAVLNYVREVAVVSSGNSTNGSANGTVYLMKFDATSTSEDGSFIRGKLAYGVQMSYLHNGIAVPDDGSQEWEMVDKINATAVMLTVDNRVLLFATRTNQYYAVDYTVAWAGMTAIVSVFVAVGWMRVGVMMMATDPQKRKEGKDMVFKASVGTLLVAFVLFGWANALGLFNWIMGG